MITLAFDKSAKECSRITNETRIRVGVGCGPQWIAVSSKWFLVDQMCSAVLPIQQIWLYRNRVGFEIKIKKYAYSDWWAAEDEDEEFSTDDTFTVLLLLLLTIPIAPIDKSRCPSLISYESISTSFK